MLNKYGESDMYWHQVYLFYTQVFGITDGYQDAAPPEESVGLIDIMWMNFIWYFNELWAALQNESHTSLKGGDHCSALIKLLDKNSDILVSHNTWDGYENMRRIVKRFHQVVGGSRDNNWQRQRSPVVFGATGWTDPGGDQTDGSQPSSRQWPQLCQDILPVQQWNLQQPMDDRRYEKICSRDCQVRPVEGSGADTGVHPQRGPDRDPCASGLLGKLQQTILPDVFNMSGNNELVQEYGDFFTYDHTPRALLFKRDQGKVVDLDSMMRLMRSNDFQHDPLSRCNCNPPCSAENAIADRGDLNPITGKYPFGNLGHRPVGATDAKVTSYKLSQELSFLAVCGPTTGTNLSPFQWSKSDFNQQIPHRGHPDLFSFEPVLISWPEH